MDTMDTNMYLAEYYLARLNDLSDRAKLYILKKLADSLVKDKETHTLTKKEKDEALDRLAGVWADDPEGERMAEAIRTGRRSNTTRKLIPFGRRKNT